MFASRTLGGAFIGLMVWPCHQHGRTGPNMLLVPVFVCETFFANWGRVEHVVGQFDLLDPVQGPVVEYQHFQTRMCNIGERQTCKLRATKTIEQIEVQYDRLDCKAARQIFDTQPNPPLLS